MTSLSGSAKSKRGADNPLATISSSSGSDEDSARACKSKDPKGESTCLPQLVHPDCFTCAVEQFSCTLDFNNKSHGRKEHKSCKNPKPKKQKADFIGSTSDQSRGSKIGGEENIFKIPANPAALNWVEEARRFKPKNRFLAKLMTNQNEGIGAQVDTHITSKPMRERSLPRSFWQQPNKPLDVSTSLFHVLPPISLEGRHHHHHHQRKKRTIRVSNIELLQKLFDVVDSLDETRHLSVEQNQDGWKNSRDAGLSIQQNFEESPLFNRGKNPFGHEALIGGSKDPYLVDPVANRVLQKMPFHQKYSNFAPLRCQGAKEGLTYSENLGVRSRWVEGHFKAPLTFLQEQQRQMSRNTQMLSELVMHI